MKNIFLTGLITAGLLLNACNGNQSTHTENTAAGSSLSASDFSATLKADPGILLDVRTAEEFRDSHLENALNMDWTASDFEQQAASLDKTKPVFVYCLSGARSAEAASFLRSKGFQTVYELEGGILQWRSANLPETEANNKAAGMSMAQYQHITSSEKIVLVDFYADWCMPCKKMEPYLKEIAKEMAGQVELVRINADDNPELCQTLGIEALPTLKVYKKGLLTWSNVGYIGKAEVQQQLQP